MPRTGWKQISKYKIALPSSTMAESFEDTLRPFFKRIIQLIFEIDSLKDLRDTLLPKLLSGEIEIPDNLEVTDDVPIPRR